MKELIDVFRMTELSPETRIRVLVKLGRAINDEHGANLTEPIVYELVKLLNPTHEIVTNKHFLNYK